MNAVAIDNSDPHAGLASLRDKRLVSQGKLAAAVATLEQKQGLEAEARSQITHWERELAEAIHQPAYRNADAKLADANSNHRWTLREVDKASDTRDKAFIVANQAAAAVEAELDRIIEAEAVEIATQIERHFDEASQLCLKLREYVNPFNVPTNRVLPDVIKQALKHTPEPDSLYVPINGALMSINASVNFLNQRRAALMNSVHAANAA